MRRPRFCVDGMTVAILGSIAAGVSFVLSIFAIPLCGVGIIMLSWLTNVPLSSQVITLLSAGISALIFSGIGAFLFWKCEPSLPLRERTLDVYLGWIGGCFVGTVAVWLLFF